MDHQVYIKTLSTLCANPQHAKYHEIFRKLEFDYPLVYGKYLFVSPPYPGKMCSIEDNARNIFSMSYNGFYNEIYNIDPYASSYEESDEESNLNTILQSDHTEDCVNNSDYLLTMVGDFTLFATGSATKTNDVPSEIPLERAEFKKTNDTNKSISY